MKSLFKTKKQPIAIEKNFFEITTNYQLFQLLPDNRDVCQKNINFLMSEIKTSGQIMPLLCKENNGKLDIYDGQNRYFALMNLNYPIKYVIDNTLQPDYVTDIQKGKQWTIIDWIKRYSVRGKYDYKTLRKKTEEYKGVFSPAALAEIYWDRNTKGNHISQFVKNGEYKINVQKGDQIINYIGSCYKADKNKKYLSRMFIRAFVEILNNCPNFKIETFLGKIQKYNLKILRTRKETCDSIIELYNYKIKLDTNRIKME